MKSLPPYTLLARFYDQMQTGSAQMTRHARNKVLGKLMSRIGSVCNLGCGTGTTAVELARKCLRVYAVDLSPTMCRLARLKARRARVAIRVICADMRTRRLPEPVDLVISEFNPLNHLPNRSDLARVARSVAKALRPGGHFYFDVNTRRTYEELSPSGHWLEKPDFCLTLHGACDRNRKKGRLDCEWFLPEGKSWRRYHECIEDVWWEDREIRAALWQAGFKRIQTWDGTEVRPADPKRRPGYDAYYLAQTPGT